MGPKASCISYLLFHFILTKRLYGKLRECDWVMITQYNSKAEQGLEPASPRYTKEYIIHWCIENSQKGRNY